MIAAIKARLLEIEQIHQVVILYACESGSRAWGFPSADSDYDVRFIYVHPASWYLSVEDRRDVIEQPIDQRLDITGWDLRKALLLLRRSNTPLLEWLGSPIVYLERYETARRMRHLARSSYSQAICYNHYLRMAQQNYALYHKDGLGSFKKLFYTLRPLLAMQWIERGHGLPPTEFGLLLERVVTDPALKEAIDVLLSQKAGGTEKDHAVPPPVVTWFITGELSRLGDFQPNDGSAPADFAALDGIFLNALAEAWDDHAA